MDCELDWGRLVRLIILKSCRSARRPADKIQALVFPTQNSNLQQQRLIREERSFPAGAFIPRLQSHAAGANLNV